MLRYCLDQKISITNKVNLILLVSRALPNLFLTLNCIKIFNKYKSSLFFKREFFCFKRHKIGANEKGENMGFIDEIKKCFTPEELPSQPEFRAVLLGQTAGYFENVKFIRYYQPNEVSLALKKGSLLIKGENLYVKKYCVGDVVVCGKITSVEMV